MCIRDRFEPHLSARVEELGLTNVEPFVANPTPLPSMLAVLEGETAGVHLSLIHI